MKKSISRFRHWWQAAFFAITNGYYKGYAGGKIYTGNAKKFCSPGLNCYSCPGAYNSCPIGSLQAVLDSRKFVVSCYVFGILMAFGTLFGRLICGWMCPFGLVQDLLHMIPIRLKKKNMPGHAKLSYIRWAVLLLLVIILPSVAVNVAGMGKPWFCEFLCPSGTLFAGIPLTMMNPGIRSAAGARFVWKISVLAVILLLSAIYYRPFCKYLCPLGLIYGMFNPVSLYQLNVDSDKCVKCGKCQKVCGMDIKVWETPNSRECIRCGACRDICPNHAITSTWERHAFRPQKRILYFVRGVLLIAAAILITVGIFTGEPSVVLAKAVKICLECIGIG